MFRRVNRWNSSEFPIRHQFDRMPRSDNKPKLELTLVNKLRWYFFFRFKFCWLYVTFFFSCFIFEQMIIANLSLSGQMLTKCYFAIWICKLFNIKSWLIITAHQIVTEKKMRINKIQYLKRIDDSINES